MAVEGFGEMVFGEFLREGSGGEMSGRWEGIDGSFRSRLLLLLILFHIAGQVPRSNKLGMKCGHT